MFNLQHKTTKENPQNYEFFVSFADVGAVEC